MNPLQGKRLVLGVTGGVAAYKTCELARLLVKAGARAVASEPAVVADQADLPLQVALDEQLLPIRRER
jgi:hypothetical protein